MIAIARSMADEQQQADDRENGKLEHREGESLELYNDVVLDVPKLSVEEIHLNVEQLHARVSLDATVAQELVQIRAGVDVDLDKVELNIKGVEAEAHLRVKLVQVARIVERALDTLRERPEIVRGAVEAAGVAAQAVDGGRLEQASRRLSSEAQIAGGAKKIQQTAKQTMSRVKRGASQVASKIPGVGNGRAHDGRNEIHGEDSTGMSGR